MSVTLKRKLANLLDRPGGRQFLSSIASHWARSLTGDRALSIMYDKMWIERNRRKVHSTITDVQLLQSRPQTMRALATERQLAPLDY